MKEYFDTREQESGDFVRCEDCAHFVSYGVDGEGECDIDGERTYYGADAMNCKDFCEKDYVVREAPTIDAVPVVHGRWEIYAKPNMVNVYGDPYKVARCNICGFEWNSPYSAIQHFVYCPNCGARMDGDD